MDIKPLEDFVRTVEQYASGNWPSTDQYYWVAGAAVRLLPLLKDLLERESVRQSKETDQHLCTCKDGHWVLNGEPKCPICNEILNLQDILFDERLGRFSVKNVGAVSGLSVDELEQLGKGYYEKIVTKAHFMHCNEKFWITLSDSIDLEFVIEE